MALLAVGSLVAVAAGMPFPLLCIYFGKLVDDLNSSACIDEPPANLEEMVRRKVIIVALFAVANFATIYVYMGCWTLFGERVVRRLRTRYLRALLRQEAAYFDTMPAGEVAARLDGDLHTIQQGVSEKVGIYVASVSNFITAYVVAFVVDSRLAVILFALVPAYYAMVHIGKYFSQKYSKTVDAAVAEASSIAAESLSNIQVVQAFRLESRLETIFADHLLKAQPAAVRRFIAAAIQLGFLFFVAHTANSVSVWLGSGQIADSVVNDTGFTFGRVYTCLLVLINGKQPAPSPDSNKTNRSSQPPSCSPKSPPSSTSSPQPPPPPPSSSKPSTAPPTSTARPTTTARSRRRPSAAPSTSPR